MTVCLAALCDQNTIIGASDRMITAGDVQFEPPQNKVWWMTSSIAVMISGDTALQTEILQGVHADVSQRIIEQPDNWWTVKEIASLYVSHYNAVRVRKAENFLLAPLGLTHDLFINRQGEMASHFVSDLASDLTRFELPPVSAIFAGADPSGSHIWLASKAASGIEISCQDTSGFVSIGMGVWHSQSQFMLAGHTRFKTFPDALLLTYSAKRRAEVAPGVGAGTDMFVIYGLGSATSSIAEYVIRDIEKIYRAAKRREVASTRRAGESIKQYVEKLLSEPSSRDQGSPPDDGLLEVRLSKDYADHQAGEVLRVDPRRAEWLRTNGFEATTEASEVVG